MADDTVVFAVIFAITSMVIGGIFAINKAIIWSEHQRGVMPLDVLVKDIEGIEGHFFCAKCSDPLRVYAVSTGYDTKTAKELFKKFGRCDHWRWWRGSGHCRQATFGKKRDRTPFDAFYSHDYQT